ncbi:MAG: ATP-dependent helicase [bacterium]|nr:ATP-dependent helicase [bacterium]MDA1024596.1 ATP-dependent helicase [bacterium]
MKEFVLSGAASPKLNIDYENELNPEQLQVVHQGDGAVLVLAGAGSGKTRTVTYRVAWLLEHGVSPDRILLLTFTNKAAREMIDRAQKLLGFYPKGLWAGTFHSIANRLLRRYAPELGYQSNFSILDQEDGRELIKLCVKELKLKAGVRFPSPNVLQSLFSYLRNKQAGLESVLESKHPKFLVHEEAIATVMRRFTEEKRKQNAMDFDDLLLNLRELLLTKPEVQKALSNQFEFILVDEFQDTNTVQADIVRRLTDVHRNILVVGDDAQSIYSFRAADIRNILDFPNSYDRAKTFRLTQNYRSTPEILSVANQVIEKNANQFEKELRANQARGEKPNIVPANNVFQEAQYIAEQIEQLATKGVSLTEISVLFRAAFHSQNLEFELMKRGVPYEYRGGMKFFERAHVKDVIAHMRVMANLKDAMAWVRVLSLHPGIGLVSANKIAGDLGALSSFNEVGDYRPTGKRVQAGFEGFLRIHGALNGVDMLPAHLIRAFAGTDEYQLYLENAYPNYQERIQDIEQFALFAEQYEDLGTFLEAVTLTDEFGAVEQGKRAYEEDRIVLSTIHQSKGLEWDTVFVMHMAEDYFPSSKSMDEHEGLEEERRLFYVAVTRARKQLFLTYPITVGREYAELKQPSLFLSELDKGACEEVQIRSAYEYGQGAYAGVQRSAQKRSNYEGYDEPTIVLDDMGESISGKAPSSFLRDIDELL